MNDATYTRAGATIAYQVSGTGRPVGYAHGVMLSRAAVERLNVFDVDAIGAGRRLLTYDARGHGHSTGRPDPADYEFQNLAADLLGLLDAAGIDEPIDFIGSSMGCATALHAAVADPRRFRRLVLMIPPVAWEEGPRLRRAWYLDSAAEIDSQGAGSWRRAWRAAEPLPIFADYPDFDISPDMPDSLLAPALRGVGNSDLPDESTLRRLRIPSLILTWDTDPLHPVDTARRLNAAMWRSRLTVATTVPEVRTWTALITEFLAEDD